MAIAAFAVSVVALVIALGSLWYVYRGGWRADPGRSREPARVDKEIRVDVGTLTRVGTAVEELAAAVKAAASDPHALRRVTAAQSRLEQAINATGLKLPVCSTYLKETNASLMPEVERELAEAKTRRRLYGL